jgi:hypothetical protein
MANSQFFMAIVSSSSLLLYLRPRAGFRLWAVLALLLVALAGALGFTLTLALTLAISTTGGQRRG